jgi:hypothetical protein
MKLINNCDGEFVFDGQLIESMKVRKNAPIAFFVQHHDHG